MKIEIIEYYPDIKKKKDVIFSGTLHVFLEEFGIDLKGIQVKRTKKGFFINLPSRWGKLDNGQDCLYPLISFADRRKHKDMVSSIREEARNYLRNQGI